MLTTSTKGNGQTKRPATPILGTLQPRVDEATRHEMIARAAYGRAERRSFKGGSAQEDWLASEIQVDAELKRAPKV